MGSESDRKNSSLVAWSFGYAFRAKREGWNIEPSRPHRVRDLGKSSPIRRQANPDPRRYQGHRRGKLVCRRSVHGPIRHRGGCLAQPHLTRAAWQSFPTPSRRFQLRLCVARPTDTEIQATQTSPVRRLHHVDVHWRIRDQEEMGRSRGQDDRPREASRFRTCKRRARPVDPEIRRRCISDSKLRLETKNQTSPTAALTTSLSKVDTSRRGIGQ